MIWFVVSEVHITFLNAINGSFLFIKSLSIVVYYTWINIIFKLIILIQQLLNFLICKFLLLSFKDKFDQWLLLFNSVFNFFILCKVWLLRYLKAKILRLFLQGLIRSVPNYSAILVLVILISSTNIHILLKVIHIQITKIISNLLNPLTLFACIAYHIISDLRYGRF